MELTPLQAISFLRSVIRSGETLSSTDDQQIDAVIAALSAEPSDPAHQWDKDKVCRQCGVSMYEVFGTGQCIPHDAKDTYINHLETEVERLKSGLDDIEKIVHAGKLKEVL